MCCLRKQINIKHNEIMNNNYDYVENILFSIKIDREKFRNEKIIKKYVKCSVI